MKTIILALTLVFALSAVALADEPATGTAGNTNTQTTNGSDNSGNTNSGDNTGAAAKKAKKDDNAGGTSTDSGTSQ